MNEFIGKSSEEMRLEDVFGYLDKLQSENVDNIDRINNADYVQDYLKENLGKYFVASRTIVIDGILPGVMQTIPKTTPGIIILSDCNDNQYCVRFIKPYDKMEYVPVNIDIISFS